MKHRGAQGDVTTPKTLENWRDRRKRKGAACDGSGGEGRSKKKLWENAPVKPRRVELNKRGDST